MPYIVDVPLHDGKFTAQVHSRPSHAQTKKISRDLRTRIKEENIEEVLVDNILTLCVDWDVTDEEGHPIPFTREGLNSDECPDDILTELSDRLQKFINRGMTIDQKIQSVADDLPEDDPRVPKLLALVDEGN
jgi:hypothetical protein